MIQHTEGTTEKSKVSSFKYYNNTCWLYVYLTPDCSGSNYKMCTSTHNIPDVTIWGAGWNDKLQSFNVLLN